MTSLRLAGLKSPVGIFVALIFLASVFVALLPSSASALKQPGLSVGPTKPTDERQYFSPWGGSQSAVWNPAPQFCDETSSTQPKWTWCDTVPLKIDAPAVITAANSYVLRVVFSWDISANDNDIRLWGCDRGGPSYAGCVSVAAAGEMTANPEVMVTGDLPGNKQYFIVPYQFSGETVQYKLKVEFKSSPFTEYVPPLKPAQVSKKSPPSQTPQDLPVFDTEQTEKPKPVKLPGEDGDPTTHELPTLLTSSEARSQDGASPLVLAGGVVGVLAIAAAFTYFLIRRRRRGATVGS